MSAVWAVRVTAWSLKLHSAFSRYMSEVVRTCVPFQEAHHPKQEVISRLARCKCVERYDARRHDSCVRDIPLGLPLCDTLGLPLKVGSGDQTVTPETSAGG